MKRRFTQGFNFSATLLLIAFLKTRVEERLHQTAFKNDMAI
jgi:hypothetical protein